MQRTEGFKDEAVTHRPSEAQCGPSRCKPRLLCSRWAFHYPVAKLLPEEGAELMFADRPRERGIFVRDLLEISPPHQGLLEPSPGYSNADVPDWPKG